MSNRTVPATAKGLPNITRREALRTLAAGSAAGALAGGVAAMAIPSAVADTMTPIERMALDLRARYGLDTSSMSDAEGDASADAFHALLDRIIRADPQTPRDVAIQWHADCLFNTSDNSDEFRERLVALSGITEGSSCKPVPMAGGVVAVATPAPATAKPIGDGMAALIERHRACAAAMGALGAPHAAAERDAMKSRSPADRAAFETINAAFNAACERTTSAMDDIVAAPIATLADMRAKAVYLAQIMPGTCEHNGTIAALLASMCAVEGRA